MVSYFVVLTAADMTLASSPGNTVRSVIMAGWTKSSRSTVEPRAGRGAFARLAATSFPILYEQVPIRLLCAYHSRFIHALYYSYLVSLYVHSLQQQHSCNISSRYVLVDVTIPMYTLLRYDTAASSLATCCVTDCCCCCVVVGPLCCTRMRLWDNN